MVEPDVETGTRLATEHLIFRGHQNIGLALLWDNPLRFAGWRQALSEAGLRAPKVRYFAHEAMGGARLSMAPAKRILQRLVKTQGCTAIVAENDLWAARLLQVCHQTGLRVPEDVAIVGYNNLEFSEFTSPALTTVDEDNVGIGNALVDRLLACIQGTVDPEAPRIISVQPSMVVRDSS